MPNVRSAHGDFGGEDDLVVIDRRLLVVGLPAVVPWIRITRESGSDTLIVPSDSCRREGRRRAAPRSCRAGCAVVLVGLVGGKPDMVGLLEPTSALLEELENRGAAAQEFDFEASWRAVSSNRSLRFRELARA